MRSVEMTLEQRLRLSLLVGEQKGTVSQIRLWSAVLGKVELSAAEQEEISMMTVETPDKRTMLHWNPMLALASKPIAFENEEARALSTLLASHPHFGPGDLAWVDALLKVLA